MECAILLKQSSERFTASASKRRGYHDQNTLGDGWIPCGTHPGSPDDGERKEIFKIACAMMKTLRKNTKRMRGVMMDYDMPLYRPPSEANSLIFQVTLGCSHNRCAFCVMYRQKKFRIRPWEELQADITEAAFSYRRTNRIFLADGDALVIDADYMIRILNFLYEKFPDLERVSAYANPNNLLGKSEEDLQRIREAGLQMLYFGIETGDDELLVKIRKGATSQELITSAKKAIDAGFVLSATIILGLAGKRKSLPHAVETARVCSAINPHYLSALTLMIEEDSPYFFRSMGEDWEMMDKLEILHELRSMIEHFQLDNCVFRSNHASNYLPIKAILNQDKERLLREIGDALKNPARLRPEYSRAL